MEVMESKARHGSIPVMDSISVRARPFSDFSKRAEGASFKAVWIMMSKERQSSVLSFN